MAKPRNKDCKLNVDQVNDAAKKREADETKLQKDINTYFPISKPVRERYKKLVIDELTKQNGEYTAIEKDHDALVKKAFPRTHKKVALAFKIRNLLEGYPLFRQTLLKYFTGDIIDIRHLKYDKK